VEDWHGVITASSGGVLDIVEAQATELEIVLAFELTFAASVISSGMGGFGFFFLDGAQT
jgi:hypothetical protein